MTQEPQQNNLPDPDKVKTMFQSIAPRYDFLNRLLSGRRDVAWRRKAVAQLSWSERGRILDIATGTADVALEVARQTAETVKITGVDFSPNMLEIGQQKVRESRYSHRIELKVADAQALPFEDGTFDSTIIAFGIRNIPDRDLALREMIRVVKPGGKVVVLEFTTPQAKILKNLYHFYFLKVLPVLGGIISGKKDAYEYLPDSVLKFPTQEEFKGIMSASGLTNVTYRNLTFGIACIHVGIAPEKK